MPSKNKSYKKKVDIKYIARLAGVSPSTVSRALRRDPTASSKTTEKIINLARELDYYPNSLAKALREKNTNTIGVIFNDLNNPFYTEILSSIGKIINEKGYSMIVSYSNWDFDQERKNIRTLLSKRVDGIIISPVDDKSKNINILLKNKIETVLIDCYPYFSGLSYVYTNHKKASAFATKYLIENGHKNIILITSFREGFIYKHFLEGYLKTLKKYNIRPKKELIIKAKELSIKSGYETFKKIINEKNIEKKLHFTAIIAISDLLAIGIYKAANELGFKIPDTYSIVGYDNIEVTSALNPPLTTVHQPRRRIGIESTRILLNNINNENKNIEKVAFDPNIIPRNSVRNIN